MKKIAIGPTTLLYPLPAVLIGSNVDSRANFMTAAWCGVACSEPPMVTVGIRSNRVTLKGIHQNLTFTVNVPSVEQVREADYCGIVSGATANKAEVCKFEVFYGKLTTAPLINQCPASMECRVAHLLDLGSHTLVVGKVEETYVSENCLTNGQPDVAKIRPFCYSKGVSQQYISLGQVVGKAFSVGLELKTKS